MAGRGGGWAGTLGERTQVGGGGCVRTRVLARTHVRSSLTRAYECLHDLAVRERRQEEARYLNEAHRTLKIKPRAERDGFYPQYAKLLKATMTKSKYEHTLTVRGAMRSARKRSREYLMIIDSSSLALQASRVAPL